MTQPTRLKIEQYERLPFTIQAVQVTPENIYQVAKWCRGKVKTAGRRGIQKYIQVEVKRALNERQTKAYVDDWVLKAGTGFKVYTPKAFEESFRKKMEHMMQTAKNMVDREKAEDEAEADQLNSETEDSLPTGGLNTSFISPAV
jgi:hypothetical protein